MALSRLSSAALLYGWVPFCACSAAAAQRGTVFRGFVTDSVHEPIANVEVTVLDVHRVARTDSAGLFVFRNLSPGTYHDVVRHPQYRPLDGTVRLAEGDSIDYQMPRMRRLAAMLDTMRVHQAGVMPWWQSGFERRRATERGTFIARDVLDARATWPLSNIIASKALGVRLTVRCRSAGSCDWALASSRHASLCFLAVWLDGQPIFLPQAGGGGAGGGGDALDLTTISPTELAAVEVYDSPAAIPPMFNMSGSACGVIALWSRTVGTGPKE
jgi:Carboxypeptidase regulatory-like domain